MRPGEILGADMATLRRWLGEGFDWWVSELAGMLPASIRRLWAGQPAITAAPVAGGGYRFMRGSTSVVGAVGRRPVALLLPRADVLVRDVAAPPLSDRDVRRLLALDIDRLTPFPASEVFVAVALPDAFQGARRFALVAAVRRAVAVEALAAARAAGLAVRALGVEGAKVAALDIDFLPAMRAEGLVSGNAPRYRWLWIVAAVLVLANVVATIGRDIVGIDRLRDAVAAQQSDVLLVSAVRREVQATDAARARIAVSRRDAEPLRVIDGVTRVLPDGAWVARLDWNPAQLRIAGFAGPEDDVVGTLRRIPMFRDAHDSGTENPGNAGAEQPFDVTARLNSRSVP